MTMRWLGIAALSVTLVSGVTTALYAQGTTRSSWDGVYTAAQADRGKVLFAAHCAKCHGASLEGLDEAPALRGPRFISDWATQSAADLIGRIHTTMPMDDPGALGQQSTTDVTAYLLQQNQMPAGDAELMDVTAAQVRIDQNKPDGK